MTVQTESSPTSPSPASGILFVVSGPSAAGKSTLVSGVIERNPGIRYCPSFTTRPQRPGEVDGCEYYFVSPDRFGELVSRNQLFEHATVYGHTYGRSKDLILDTLRLGHDVVMNVDVQGAATARIVLSESVSIFIMPPSLDVLRQRLLDRGTEKGSMLERRLDIAREEIQRYLEFEYVLVNEELESALAMLEAIIHAECHRKQGRGKIYDAAMKRAEAHRLPAMTRTAERIVATFEA